MTEVLWPPDLCPSSQTWNIIGNAATFTSPLSGATRTYGRPGARLGCTMTFPPMRGQDRARLLAFINTLLDRSNRAWVPDFSTTRRGSFSVSELLTNNDFSNGTTGWSGRGGANSLSVADRRIRSTLLENVTYGVGFHNSSAITSAVQYAPYAMRAFTLRGQGDVQTVLARIGTTAGDGDIAEGSSSTYGMATASGVPVSVSSIYATMVGSLDGLVAGDFVDTQFISLARCGLADNPGNRLTYSDQFDNAAWTKTNATITANNGSAPNATLTADSLVESSANGAHFVSQSYTVASAAADYCFGISLHAGNRNFAVVTLREATGSTSVYQYFNLATGAVGTTGGTESNWSNRRAFIVNKGGGWYDCFIIGRKTNAATTVTAEVYAASADGTSSYAGNNAVTAIYLWRGTAVQSSVPVRLTQSTTAAVSASAQTSTGIYVKGLPASTQGLLEAGDPVQIGGQINFLTARLDSDAAGRGYLQCGRPWLAASNDAPVIVHQPMCKMILATDTIDLDTGPGQFSPFQIELVEAVE